MFKFLEEFFGLAQTARSPRQQHDHRTRSVGRACVARPVGRETGKPLHCPDINALVTFADDAAVVSGFAALTDASFATAVRSLPGRVSGLTNMAAGLNASIGLFSSAPKGLRRKVVLLTDGHATCDKAAVRGAARRAKNAWINLDTVGIGAEGDFDGPLLREISALTHNGRFHHCGGVAALDRAFGHGRARSISHIGQATVFLVDVSTSMRELFGDQSRIQAVGQAIERLVRVKQKLWS